MYRCSRQKEASCQQKKERRQEKFGTGKCDYHLTEFASDDNTMEMDVRLAIQRLETWTRQNDPLAQRKLKPISDDGIFQLANFHCDK